MEELPSVQWVDVAIIVILFVIREMTRGVVDPGSIRILEMIEDGFLGRIGDAIWMGGPNVMERIGDADWERRPNILDRIIVGRTVGEVGRKMEGRAACFFHTRIIDP